MRIRNRKKIHSHREEGRRHRYVKRKWRDRKRLGRVCRALEVSCHKILASTYQNVVGQCLVCPCVVHGCSQVNPSVQDHQKWSVHATQRVADSTELNQMCRAAETGH